MVVCVTYKEIINKEAVNKISCKNYIAKLHVGFILIIKYSESVLLLFHLQLYEKF